MLLLESESFQEIYPKKWFLCKNIRLLFVSLLQTLKEKKQIRCRNTYAVEGVSTKEKKRRIPFIHDFPLGLNMYMDFYYYKISCTFLHIHLFSPAYKHIHAVILFI